MMVPWGPRLPLKMETGDVGSMYIMNELSFEIKKLSAEVKHISFGTRKFEIT
ncbi:MAG: hypothetical protein CM1200mP10_17300 [Candidatus Neomarinimicrobiota bacterium]|nr:MAG: hypothetical protein CM1200mP10_17300 [Candidatus Neomarinimicrobiota bacterium]